MSAPPSWQSELRQLQAVFRVGYSGYLPLSVCRVAGKVPGDLDREAIDPYWPVLLNGHGEPWRKVLTLALRADSPREPEPYPVYDCYWAPRLEPDLAPVERRFFELGSQAAEVLAEAGLLGYTIGKTRPTHPGQGRHWVDFLFRLAWEGSSRVLQAPRFRLHYKAEENSYLFANWHEGMDDNPCMIHSTIRFRDVNPAYASEPWGGDIWKEAEVNPQAKLAFPHRFISYLEDLFQASASAIELLLREPAPTVGASAQGRIRAGEAALRAAENDPQALKDLARVRVQLKAFAAAVAAVQNQVTSDPEVQRLEAERQQVFEELSRHVNECMDGANADLEAVGFSPPGWDIDNWAELARIVEKDPGPMTLGEIYDWAMAWVKRERMRLKLAHEQRAVIEANKQLDGGPSTGLTGRPLNPPKKQEHPDGLDGGCWLWWNNQRHDVPKGVIYRLLAFMWTRDSAAYDSLEGPVFEDPILHSTVRARSSEANKILKKIGIPWRLKPDSVNRFLTKQPVK